MEQHAEHRTICRMCHGGCGVVVQVKDGRVTGLRGDVENPNNRGFLCTKGRASLELLEHPDRLKHPLRRVGPKGSGAFVRIDWEEAYEEVATRLRAVRESLGPESVVFAQGTDRNYQEWLFRFAHVFGSPNVLGPAHVCFYPRVMAGLFTLGGFTFADYEGTPECLLVWGSNKVVTHGDGVIGTRLLAALERGTQLIVVDPRRTPLAHKARYWLRVKPGTDAALALGMLHVIIHSGLYDADFVREYTTGFEALARHVEPYTPEAVSALTSVPAELIRESATFYARAASAALEVGTGVEQNRHSFHTTRALCLLSALCGNLDKPGGDVLWEPTGLIGRRAFPLTERLPGPQHRKRLGAGRHRLLSMGGWAHPEAVWRAILEEQPYPVKMMFVMGSNLLVNYADSERVHAALQRLEYLVVSELFLTPTARMADIVLPASGWLERNQVVEHAHYVAARPQLAQVGECRPDEEMLNELAVRLGLGDFWGSVEEALDDKLRPLGQTWRQFAERHYLANTLVYFKYKQKGFRTRSGKVELYSEWLKEWGYSPLPTYTPPAAPPPEQRAYLVTSAHSPFFFNSEFRNLPSLRRCEPEPFVEMHPDTARQEGLQEGDTVRLRVGEKAATFRARLSPHLSPEVLCASATGWYPELPFEESWRRSNLNRLTRNGEENEEMGSSNLRGVWCHLERAGGSEEAPSQEACLREGT